VNLLVTVLSVSCLVFLVAGAVLKLDAWLNRHEEDR
jgi:hypothetical protein